MAEFTAAVARAVQVPADLPGLLSLASVAACAQRRFVIQVTEAHREPLSLFVATILGSGERKSAVVRAVTEPIADWERAESARLGEQVAVERSRRTVEAKRRDNLEERAAKTDDAGKRREFEDEAAAIAARLASTPDPVLPRVLADDVTPEALGRLMAEQGERMALFSAEGGVFETMAGRYSNGTPNLDVFLKGHAGDELRIDRRNGPPVIMRAPALTMGLAVQPDVLRSLVDKPGFRGRGLLARWLYGLPVSRVGYRDAVAPAVPRPIRDAYHACIGRLLKLEQHGDPVVLRPSPEALATWRAFSARVEERMRPGADLAHLQDWAGKAPGLAARMAAIMHLAAGADGDIAASLMASAVTIVEDYAIVHARAAFGEMGADQELDAAGAVVEWMTAHGIQDASVRDVHRAMDGQVRFKHVEAVERALALGEKHGYLRRLPDPPRRPGRPPSPRYELVRAVTGWQGQKGQKGHNMATMADSVPSVGSVPAPSGAEDCAEVEPAEEGEL